MIQAIWWVFAALVIRVPLGLDQLVPSPAGNPWTPAKTELGRALFFDKQLSRDQTVSCASCRPRLAFAGRRF